MPINANVSGQPQIQASVGETQIDVSVAGGFGPSGANGAAASITVGTVTTGSPGSSASVVNAGTSSAAVLNFTIPAGATGATGATGQQGATGPAGTTTWAGITDRPATFPPSTHNHVAANITDFAAAVVAAAPPTTNASLLTSGTLPDARLSANIARTSDITTAVASVVNAAPAALDTLHELAAALGNDASFSVTVTNALAAKAPLASPTFTGTVSGVTKAMVGLSDVPNTDATARANHTGTQAISTVSGLQTALDAKASLAHSHGFLQDAGDLQTSTGSSTSGTIAVVGAAGLPSAGKLVAASQLFGLTVTPLPANGLSVVYGTSALTACQGNDARLSDARTPLSHTHTASAITDFSSAVAAASPEEVVEYLTAASFPATGNSSLLYIATDAGRAYRWVGSEYAEIGPTSVSVSGGGAGVTDGSKGDITVSGSGATWTINAGAVVTADLADGAVTDAKVTSITAEKITSGTIATARLGSGSATSTTFLAGDQTWKTVTSGSTNASGLTSGTLANARLTTRARASMNLYISSTFR